MKSIELRQLNSQLCQDLTEQEMSHVSGGIFGGVFDFLGDIIGGDGDRNDSTTSTDNTSKYNNSFNDNNSGVKTGGQPFFSDPLFVGL